MSGEVIKLEEPKEEEGREREVFGSALRRERTWMRPHEHEASSPM